MKLGRRHDATAETHPDEHRDGERIVVLAQLPSRFAADAIVAALEARGVKATASHSDAGGWAPHLSVYSGHRVLVFEGDVEIARALLVEEGLTDQDLADS